MDDSPRDLAHSMLEAVESRDVEAFLGYFSAEATWQNVPHPEVVGHGGIRAMLGPILERSEKVRWDVVSEAYAEHRAWLERVDRFWIDGQEYAARCNGVIEFDPETGLITEFRDYVDLGEWRSRISQAGPLR